MFSGGSFDGSFFVFGNAVNPTQADIIAGGPCDPPFPVELVSFSANAVSNSVKLFWKTATEVNNYGFDVERSPSQPSQREGVSDSPFGGKEGGWTKIGFVQGHGNSNSPKEYSFTDKFVPSGTYTYRLKQIDIDGAFEYYESAEVEVAAPKEFALKQNYPNPFNPLTVISWQLPTASNVSLKIYDALGREIKTLINETQQAGIHKVKFDGSAFASGIYLYKLSAASPVGNFISTKRMLIVK